MSAALPDPRLTRIPRLEATLGAPLNLGEASVGARLAAGVSYETWLVE
jgi:hypothetical protein